MVTLMNLRQAAEYLGKNRLTMRRIYYAGLIEATRDSSNSLVFAVADLDKLKKQQYPEGMSHSQISNRYGVKRGKVIYHFQRLHVKPLGVNRTYGHALYDEATVIKFAKILGWKEQPPAPENPTHAT